MNMPHKISQRILSSDCKSIFLSDLQCYSLPRKWPIWYGNYALKKITIFIGVFLFYGFFSENECITGKIQHFSILLSITTSFTSRKKTLKTNTSHYFELYLEISSEYLGQKIITFKRDFQWKKKEKKKSHQLTLTSCQNWQWSNWWVVGPDFYSTLGGSGPLTGPPPP